MKSWPAEVKRKTDVERLKWVLDFAYLDLSSIGKWDLMKLWEEYLENIINPMFNTDEEALGYTIPFDDDGNSLNYTIGESDELTNEEKKIVFRLLTEFQNETINTLKKIYDNKDQKEATLIYRREHSNIYSVWVGGNQISLEERHIDKKEPFSIELVELIIRTSPNGKSLDHIRRCKAEGCNKYFLKEHKRDKNYCSNKCTWRAYSKARRGEGKKTEAKAKRKGV